MAEVVASMDGNAERFLPIEGVINFRDFGGYATASGTRIKSGRLFRSASHGGATDAALDAMAALDIAVIVDLRRPTERQRDPSRRHADYAGQVITCDLVGDAGDDPWWSFVTRSDLSEAAFRAYLTDYYAGLPFEPRYIELYSRYFRALAETDGAVLIHCTGGKDRTGILAALTHHLLQVPQEDIVADYLLTNAVPDIEKKVPVLMQKIAQGTGREPSVAAVRAAWLADESYLLSAIESIQAAQGSLDNYLGAVLGVDADLRRRIESRLLA